MPPPHRMFNVVEILPLQVPTNDDDEVDAVDDELALDDELDVDEDDGEVADEHAHVAITSSDTTTPIRTLLATQLSIRISGETSKTLNDVLY